MYYTATNKKSSRGKIFCKTGFSFNAFVPDCQNYDRKKTVIRQRIVGGIICLAGGYACNRGIK